MIAWLLLPVAAFVAFLLASMHPEQPPLREQPFELGSGLGIAKTVDVDHPLVLPRIFGDFDASFELELPEDAELDIVLRWMTPHEVDQEVVSFPARFVALRMSTISEGPAWWGRETLLFDPLALHEVTGGMKLSPGLPATVWIEARGRRIRANVAGRWTEWLETVDDRGSFAMILRDRASTPEVDESTQEPPRDGGSGESTDNTPDGTPQTAREKLLAGLAADSLAVGPTREVRIRTMKITPHPTKPRPRDLLWSTLGLIAVCLGLVLAWLFVRTRHRARTAGAPHAAAKYWLGLAVAACALPVCAHAGTVAVQSRALPLTEQSFTAYWWLACSGIPFALAALSWSQRWQVRLTAILVAAVAALACVEAAFRVERPRATDTREAAVVEWFGSAADSLPFDVIVPRIRNPLEVLLPEPADDVVLFLGGGRQLWAPVADFVNPGPAVLAVVHAAQELGEVGQDLKAAFVPTAYGPIGRGVALWQRFFRGFHPRVVVAGLGLLESEPKPALEAAELVLEQLGEEGEDDGRSVLAWFDAVPDFDLKPGSVATLEAEMRELHRLAIEQGAAVVFVAGPFLPAEFRAVAMAAAEDMELSCVDWSESTTRGSDAAQAALLQAALVKSLSAK